MKKRCPVIKGENITEELAELVLKDERRFICRKSEIRQFMNHQHNR